MMRRLLFCLALALPLAACDSGSDDDDNGGRSCASIGLQEIGTVTATTPEGSFSSSCGIAATSTGTLGIVIRDPAGDGALGGETLEFVIDDPRVGVYVLGRDDADLSTASYGRTATTKVEAASGTITVRSLDDGLDATFSFTTLTGQEVTNGRLSLDI